MNWLDRDVAMTEMTWEDFVDVPLEECPWQSYFDGVEAHNEELEYQRRMSMAEHPSAKPSMGTDELYEVMYALIIGKSAFSYGDPDRELIEQAIETLEPYLNPVTYASRFPQYKPMISRG